MSAILSIPLPLTAEALIRCTVGCLFVVFILPFLYRSLKQRLHLSSPKASLSELVKIYLNPRTVLRAIGNGMKKLHRMLKGWVCVTKSRMVFRLVNNDSSTNPASDCAGNNKLSACSWCNLLDVARLQNKRMREVWLPKMNPNLPDEEWPILRVVSDEYIDGCWITTYAYLKPERNPDLHKIQCGADQIFNPSCDCNNNGGDAHKTKDVAKHPSD